MNGYQRRAPFYRSQFAVRDDFPLLRRLLTGSESLVVVRRRPAPARAPSA
jgi:hypothetical protein